MLIKAEEFENRSNFKKFFFKYIPYSMKTNLSSPKLKWVEKQSLKLMRERERERGKYNL